MSAARRCRIVFLWHMHQPSYQSPVSGQYVLPWVLLHAMRDYYDMPFAASRVEGARPVFNLVPGLLQQLDDYACLRAPDRFLLLALKDAEELTEVEKQFLLDNFLQVHPETMLKPYARFRELADKARTYVAGQSGRGRFSVQELTDLQLWYFLSWTGPTMRADERVKGLFEKGRGFTRSDKELLRDAGFELLARIIPFYRSLLAERRIDVSTSPMYHPILPLLINTQSAREAVPDMPLPAGQFVHPEDAYWHVAEGLRLVGEKMGQPVQGMWPSEGSVSTDTLKVLSTCGVKWAATDEKMLHAVLGSGHDHVAASCTPWLLGDTALFFRNSMLSDLIGFVYSRWEPETAARHFVQELGKVADASGSADPVVTIAMDGENAWEYYVHGGMRFVDALYRAITADGRFRMVSPLEVLEEAGSLPHLDRVQAGSWIDGTFRTWIGDPVKNTAWEHLLSARNAVASHLKKNNVPDAERAQLQDLMMRAEASDWFWWYGKGHSSPYDAEFDELYRDHLQAIYEKLRMRPPEALSEPLDPENRDPVACRPPVHLISPAITGREDGYYKWLSSGVVEAQEGFSHRPDVTLQELRFGFDLDRLYLKVTGSAAMRQLMEERRMSVELHFVLPEQRSYAVSLGDDGQTRVEGGEHSRDRRGIDAAVGSVLEMAIPLRRLGVEAGADDGRDVVEMYLVVVRKGREVERFPHSSSVVFTVRGEDLDAENWHV